jgi:hypothetical protein
MRKLLLLVLAVVLGMTAMPALAQTQIEFDGHLKVYHENLVNYDRATDADSRDSDSLFYNQLQLNVRVKPTEDITLHWTMRTIDENFYRWGRYAAGVGGGVGATSVFTRWLYAEVNQPWGTILVGRLADGLPNNAGGLASLGYGPTWGPEGITYVSPFDINGPTDGIAYNHDFDNGFGLAVYYAKDEADPFVGTAAATGWPVEVQTKDADRDRIGIEPRYQWDTGGVSLGLAYVRDRRPGIDTDAAGNYNEFYSTERNDVFLINPAFAQSWGPFSIHFEGQIAFGKWKGREYDLVNNTYGRLEDEKVRGLGLYLDFVYNYGAGDITLMSWISGGSSYDDDDTFKNAVVMGDFAPFLVAYNSVTLGAGTWSRSLPVDDDVEMTNHWGIGLLGNHSITDDISLNYGVGFFRLVAQDYRNQSKNLGWEIDLGASFQLLDNLSFETKFGYMFNGDAWKGYGGPANAPNIDRDSPKDTFDWVNVLAVTF